MFIVFDITHCHVDYVEGGLIGPCCSYGCEIRKRTLVFLFLKISRVNSLYFVPFKKKKSEKITCRVLHEPLLLSPYDYSKTEISAKSAYELVETREVKWNKNQASP